MFNGRRIEELLPKELEQLQTRLDEIETAKRRAGATTINMPTESERGAGYLASRLQSSLEQYQNVVGGNPKAALPTLSAEVVKGVTRSDYLKNLVNPEDRQRVEAAQLDMISAALTLSTGAAYTKEELEAQRAALFPQLGDKPATVRDKAVRLNNLLTQAKIKAGRAAPTASTNAPITFDINAINQELENRKKGK